MPHQTRQATDLSIIESANRLAALLEAAAPRRGLKHQRHVRYLSPARKSIEKLVRHYFARQEAALLRDVEPRINSTLELFQQYREARSTSGKRFSQTLVPSSLSPLRFPVSGEDLREYDTAITSAIAGATKVLAKELKTGAKISDDVAGRWLRDNSLSKLTGGFNDTTVERLQDAIADAWDKGGSYDQVVSAIKETFQDFSDTRAGLIAQTEVNEAYNFGRQETAKEWGADEKAWETESGNPCEICLANEDQGYIDFDEDFDSGDDAPPAHPNCQCTVNFRKTAGE